MKLSKKRSPSYIKETFPFYMSVQENRRRLVSMHWHEEYEIIRILRGPVLIQIDEHRLTLNTGDIFVLANSHNHALYAIGETDKAIQGIVFSDSILENTLTITTQINMYTATSPIPIIIINNSHPLNSTLASYMDELYSEYTQKRAFFEIAIKGKLYQFFSALLRYLYELNSDTSDKHIKTDNFLKLKPALEFISNNYNQKITLKQLSDTVNMSPYYFNRFFKSIMNYSPINYTIRYRIKIAAQLLSSSTLSINEISEAVGFSSCNYFDRTFKEIYGITPLNYRQNILTK